MRSSPSALICALAMISLGRSAGADSASYQTIVGVQSANDMTPDGRYIVGETNTGAYRLDTLTNTLLLIPGPGYKAAAVSDDGSVILGDMVDPGTNAEVAAIWRASTNTWQNLGYLPNAQSCPSRSNGYELSADGTVAIGLSWVGCSGRGFRWTQATGMVELQSLANGNNRASVVSGDGNLIGGFAQGSFDRTPAIWNGAAVGQLLDPPSGNAQGEIYSINHPGTIMLGTWNQQACIWTYPALARSVIGSGSLLPGWTGVPMDIANNGTIVGFDFSFGNRRAWILPPGNANMIDLKSYVNANGGNVPANINLEVCQAISNDGRKIIGHGFGTGAFIITIVKSCPADIAPSGGNNTVDVGDLLAVINAWGPCPAAPAPCPADITPPGGNGQVNVSDLLAVINAWGACPAPVGACCTGSSCSQTTQANCHSSGGTYLGNSAPCSTNACINNDHCPDAIDITANINGTPVSGDNSLATPPFGGGDTELPFGSPTCHFAEDPASAHSTVWYTFVAPRNGKVTIGTCTSVPAPFSDSTLGLYSGKCGSLVEIGCGEDECGSAYYSRIVATGLTFGNTYRICVMNPGDWVGSVPGPFTLTITSP